jgi:NAD(P)-dependent dehydrogenase (short-subunit alcohol dehydrogenase family)
MTGSRLDAKTALITGAGGGIGLEAVKLFLSEGARVIAVDAVEEKRETVMNAAGDRSDAVSFITADVSDDAQVQEMIATAQREGGGLHVLFNNAGIFPSDDAGVTETPEPTWDRVMEVNLKGVWLGCKHGIPALLESGGGSIVNVASFVALMGAATAQIAYTASKGGVLAMTREIAVEYARQGVRANAICPGPIDTPLLAPIMNDPAKRARRLVHIPMGRLGRPEEIARAALFLASDDASFITGTALIVDGGITAAYVTPEET